MQITVYYDDHEGRQAPQWMVIYYGRGVIQWEKPYAYIPIQAPFCRKLSEEFCDDILSASIQIDDLTINMQRSDCFGVDLQRIKRRLLSLKSDPSDVEQFIIQMGDIEEVLQLDAVRYYLP